MEIISFFIGVVFFYFKKFTCILCILVLCFLNKKLNFILYFILGILWAILHQYLISSNFYFQEVVIPNANIEGYIASIPAKTSSKTQFEFQIEKINNKKTQVKALISCFKDCPKFTPGQYWNLITTLKSPKNLNNPQNFDTEKRMQAMHIALLGNAKNNSFKLLPKQKKLYLLNWRMSLAHKLKSLALNKSFFSVVEALTVGLTQNLQKDDWELFRRTGTLHLMVISGAHIGFIASLVFFLAQNLWIFIPRLNARYPAQKFAAYMALLAATIYAAVAGFGIPAERALIMCFFMLLRFIISKKFTSWQAWRYALLAVIIHEPHSVLMVGFYLSFIAVAILILVNNRISYIGFKKNFVLQCACIVGLLPFTLFCFSYGSLNGLLANIVAIPFVGFCIIPLSLLTLFSSVWVVLPKMYMLLNYAISLFYKYLHWVDSISLINIVYKIQKLDHLIAMTVGLIILLFLPTKPFKVIGILLLTFNFFPYKNFPQKDEFRVNVMDVGQGLALIIETANHILVYDTGIKFFKGYDMGQLVLVPHLNFIKRTFIDKVILSHHDLDHIGGYDSLEKNMRIGELIVDNPRNYHSFSKSCHNYAPWRWDGVDFEFLPINKKFKGKNNNSCILKITSGAKSILLTGDIEKKAEYYLIQKYGKKLASSVLLVPHHGSKTSSSKKFIKKVSPTLAIASYGFANRYHFPHKKITEHYKNAHINFISTQECGMISVHFSKTNYSLKTYTNCNTYG